MNAAAGSAVEIDGTTGNGTLKLNASGETATGRYEVHGVGGALAAGFGRTEVDDLSFARESGRLMLGSGTVAYTGASPADNVHLALAPDRTDENKATVFENAVNVRVTEVTGGGSCALIKTGGGTLAFGGTSAMQFKGTASWANTATDLIAESGNAPTTCFRGLSVAQGTVAIGAVNDSSDAPAVTSDQICVGLCCSPTNSGTAAGFVVNNGTVDLTSNLLLGNFATKSQAAFNVEYVQNGGTVNVGGSMFIGYAGSGTSQQAINGDVVVNGGRLTVSNTLYPSYGRRKYSGQQNTVSVNAGEFAVKDVVGVSYAQSTGDPAPSTISVNGGEFTVSRNYTFVYRKNETHTLELNDGVFRLGGDQHGGHRSERCREVQRRRVPPAFVRSVG